MSADITPLSVTVNYGYFWQPGTITNAAIVQPQNQTSSPYTPVAVITSAGSSENCSESSAAACDVKTYEGVNTAVNDAVNYSWSSGGGTFTTQTTGPTSIDSQSGTWYAPATVTSGTSDQLTCTVSAVPATMGPYDGGTTGPSPVSSSVSVYLPVLTVNGDPSADPHPAPTLVPVTFSASSTVSPNSIPGVTNVYTWSIGTIYASPHGDQGDFAAVSGATEGSGTVSTSGANAQFIETFLSEGWYIIQVNESVAMQDANGNTLYTLSGSGYVGGTAADFNPPASGGGGSGSDEEADDDDDAAGSGTVPDDDGTRIKHAISITFNGAKATNKTEAVDPGEQIKLVATPTSPLNIPNGTWTLSGGSPIKNWNQGVLSQLGTGDYDSNTITFYLIYPGQGCTATYSGYDQNGNFRTASVSFTVNAKPAYVFYASTGTLNGDGQLLGPLSAYAEGGYSNIGLGNTNTNMVGIQFDWDYLGEAPAPNGADVQVCQLLYEYDTHQLGTGSGGPVLRRTLRPELDTEFPYDDRVDTPEYGRGTPLPMTGSCQ